MSEGDAELVADGPGDEPTPASAAPAPLDPRAVRVTLAPALAHVGLPPLVVEPADAARAELRDQGHGRATLTVSDPGSGPRHDDPRAPRAV